MNVGNLEDYGLESETVLYLERVLALNEFEGFVVPVSYTHLTLPTIA